MSYLPYLYKRYPSLSPQLPCYWMHYIFSQKMNARKWLKLCFYRTFMTRQTSINSNLFSYNNLHIQVLFKGTQLKLFLSSHSFHFGYDSSFSFCVQSKKNCVDKPEMLSTKCIYSCDASVGLLCHVSFHPLSPVGPSSCCSHIVHHLLAQIGTGDQAIIVSLPPINAPFSLTLKLFGYDISEQVTGFLIIDIEYL